MRVYVLTREEVKDRQWKGYLSERNLESTHGLQTQGVHRDAFVQQDGTRSRK